MSQSSARRRASNKSKPPAPLSITDSKHLMEALNDAYQQTRYHRMNPRKTGAIAHILDIALKALMPRQPMQITQQITTGATPDQIIAEFVAGLPSELKNAVIAHFSRPKMAANSQGAGEPTIVH